MSFVLTLKVDGQFHRTSDKSKILVTELNESEYKFLKYALEKYSREIVNDTIILKYDFNRESCWDMLDRQSDSYIQSVIRHRQLFIQQQSLSRKSVSVLRFRERGNSFNKLIDWDGTILVDQKKEIYKALFKKRSSICGTSAIVLPDRRVVIVFSDSHFEALTYSKEKISKLLDN